MGGDRRLDSAGVPRLEALNSEGITKYAMLTALLPNLTGFSIPSGALQLNCSTKAAKTGGEGRAIGQHGDARREFTPTGHRRHRGPAAPCQLPPPPHPPPPPHEEPPPQEEESPPPHPPDTGPPPAHQLLSERRFLVVEAPRTARPPLASRGTRERRLARALSRLATLDTSPTSAIVTMTTTTAIPKPVIGLTAFRSPEARPSAPRRTAAPALIPPRPALTCP